MIRREMIVMFVHLCLQMYIYKMYKIKAECMINVQVKRVSVYL